MRTKIAPFLFLSLLIFSCNSDDDDTNEDVICNQDNNKVSMNRFVKSDIKSNYVSNYYSYNELNLLSSRTRTSTNRIYEYEYVYDCNNNLIERNVEETKDPEYDGSSSFYEYDDQNRLIGYRISYQGENDYSLSYQGNVVSVSGTVWNDQNVSLTMQLNGDGLVSRMDLYPNRANSNDIRYTLFEYDSNGNMIKADDFDEAGNMINSISLTYDSNTNPYYDQFKSIYLHRFIQIFYFGGHWAGNTISSDEFRFPYLKNNIELVIDNLCNNCYTEVVNRVYNYDEQTYPNKVTNSYWGAPPFTKDIEYN